MMMPPAGAVKQFPQAFHAPQISPSGLLRKRYKINEPITEATEVVYGFDQQSKISKNTKVMIKVFFGEANREEY